MSLIDDLTQAARRVIDETGTFSVYPLSGLADNRTWYVAHQRGRCLARIPEQHGGLTIPPVLEYELLRMAAADGIAPQPLGHDSVTDIIFVTELENCPPLSARQFSASDSAAGVSQTLQRLHALSAPAELRRFDPLEFAKSYCADIAESAAPQAQLLYAECEKLTAECAQLLSGSCICHNDLHAGNLLVGEQFWLIDFEYAVQAAPIVDVASFVAYNNLDDAGTAISFARKCLREDLGFSLAQFQAVVGIHRALGKLWEIARSDNNATS